jgi:hypothetical protein
VPRRVGVSLWWPSPSGTPLPWSGGATVDKYEVALTGQGGMHVGPSFPIHSSLPPNVGVPVPPCTCVSKPMHMPAPVGVWRVVWDVVVWCGGAPTGCYPTVAHPTRQLLLHIATPYLSPQAKTPPHPFQVLSTTYVTHWLCYLRCCHHKCCWMWGVLFCQPCVLVHHPWCTVTAAAPPLLPWGHHPLILPLRHHSLHTCHCSSVLWLGQGW